MAWLAYSAALGALYVRVPGSPDHAVFDYIGWMALKGARLYADVGEQNFPGQMWLHMASTALFGNHLWSFRLFDYFLTIIGAGALLSLLHLAQTRLAGYVAVPLYQAMIVTANHWVSGQRDLVAALVLAAAGLAYVSRRRGGGIATVVLFSGLAVFAVLIRPTYAVFPAILFAADFAGSLREARRARTILLDAGLAAVVCFVLLSGVAIVFWRTGGLAAWYELAVRFNVEVYGQTETYGYVTRQLLGLVPSWHWYFAFGICGAWLWWRDGRDRLVGIVFASIAVTAIVSMYAQRKGFGYHAAGLLPVLASMAAYLIARTVLAIRRGCTWRWAGFGFLVIGIAAGGIAKKIGNGMRPQIEFYLGKRTERALLATYDAGPRGFSAADASEAATYIRRSTLPNATVLTWSRALQVNFLAQRASPSRFPTIGMLVLAREPFSRARAWTDEIAEMFETQPPEIILVPAIGITAEDASPSGPVEVLAQALFARYVRERSFGAMELYRRAR